MAELVQGLRPERNGTSVTRKDGRAAVDRAKNTSVGLAPAAGRVQTYAGNVAAQQTNKSQALVQALSGISNGLANYATVRQKNVDAEITASAQYHIDRIKQEAGTDIVSRVQIGEMLPEASAIVTAKLAQEMGKQYAQEAWKPAFEAIEGDDNIRLNSAVRSDILNDYRNKLEAQSDDPFYLTGMVEGFEAEISANENRWIKETADNHKQILRQGAERDIAAIIIKGGDLEKWDTDAKQTSPFGNVERNEMVLQTATAMAIESRDETLLDKIPKRFLNAESQRALNITQQQIKAARWTEQTQEWQREDRQTKERIRGGQIEIIGNFIDSGTLNPAAYRNDPELYAFALTMVEKESVDPIRSASNLSLFKEAVMTAADADDPSVGLGAFGYYGDMSLDSIQTWVAENPQMMRTEDTLTLFKALPELLENKTILRDPVVSESFDVYLKPSLTAIRNSANQDLAAILNGNNFETTVSRYYYQTVAAEIEAYREEHNGQAPKRRALLDIIDTVTDKTIKVTEHLSTAKTIGQDANDAIDAIEGEQVYDPLTGDFR